IAVFKLRRCSCAAAAAVAARRYRRVRTPRGSAKATSSRVANKWCGETIGGSAARHRCDNPGRKCGGSGPKWNGEKGYVLHWHPATHGWLQKRNAYTGSLPGVHTRTVIFDPPGGKCTGRVPVNQVCAVLGWKE
uniref:MIB/HERC2 domain-containing protein n=1 Tax=Mesocestoides corti TaxID=53468 RepID=A0A5K3FZC2_MESCO